MYASSNPTRRRNPIAARDAVETYRPGRDTSWRYRPIAQTYAGIGIGAAGTTGAIGTSRLERSLDNVDVSTAVNINHVEANLKRRRPANHRRQRAVAIRLRGCPGSTYPLAGKPSNTALFVPGDGIKAGAKAVSAAGLDLNKNNHRDIGSAGSNN